MATEVSDAAAHIEHRLSAHTVCFSDDEPPSGHRFSVHLRCHATVSTEYILARRRGRRVRAAGELTNSLDATFPILDHAALRGDAAACRAAVRAMLSEMPQLRSLGLSDDELDAVVPQDVAHEIAASLAVRADVDACTFSFTMAVELRVVRSEPKALMMACKELVDGIASDDECAICMDGIGGEGRAAVMLPWCAHAFHRECIAKWFHRAPVCPMCRGDVRKNTLLDFIDYLNRRDHEND